jgi:Fuc2NAc and GlcNAc transferase
MTLTLALMLASAALSALITYVVLRVALAHGLLDVPNPRSSHARPTPRGGGAGIVIASTGTFIALDLLGRLDGHLLAALLGGLLVAGVGLIDDQRPLSAKLRLSVHLIAALWAVAWLGGLPPLRVGTHLVALGAAGYLVATLAVAWAINLFNFMDGIDGIAACEAAFVAAAGGALGLGTGAAAGPAFAFAAACAGFLIWNWPPARIFMGDVGSGYLGYVVAVLALASAREEAAAAWTWLTLGGFFFVDATVTLARRLVRREPLAEAHRSHAYQWLARRWGSHASVTAALLLVNICWLLPAAIGTAKFPHHAAWITLAALASMAILALVAGAGRPETPHGARLSVGQR